MLGPKGTYRLEMHFGLYRLGKILKSLTSFRPPGRLIWTGATADSDEARPWHHADRSATTLSAAAQKFAQSLMRARRFSSLAPR